MNRRAANDANVVAVAHRRVAVPASASEAISVGRRPIRSATGPRMSPPDHGACQSSGKDLTDGVRASN